MANQDHAYKLLFSHAEMVRDLLEGFVKEEWLSQLDYESLEKVGSSYVSDDLRERSDDVVWRVRWGEDWIYLYLLLEFQSTVEAYMAVRILTYVGLLYQDLIRTRQLAADGRLPPVLAIVLYNGAARWRAPED
jgi:predicted transposase YdaD